ncbi:MAG: hypothetical protein L0216_00405, partial [Planctomycetales bacterium]|nr:hypothetical protein [Planctomycetales bacterium]
MRGRPVLAAALLAGCSLGAPESEEALRRDAAGRDLAPLRLAWLHAADRRPSGAPLPLRRDELRVLPGEPGSGLVLLLEGDRFALLDGKTGSRRWSAALRERPPGAPADPAAALAVGARLLLPVAAGPSPRPGVEPARPCEGVVWDPAAGKVAARVPLAP